MSDWFEKLAAGLPAPESGSEWPAALRAQGARAFERSGIPGKGVEEWKYTSLRSLEQLGPALGSPSGGVPQTAAEPVVEAPLRLRMHDGDFVAAQGDIPAGLRIQSLGAALEDRVEGLRDLLEGIDDSDRSQSLSALNTAVLQAGLVMSVDAGADAGDVLLQWSGADRANRLYNTRVCVLLGEGARLNLLEQFDDLSGSASLLNGVWQFQLGANAQMNLARIQRLGPESTLLTRNEVRQAQSSRLHFTALDLGGGLVRHDLRTALNGQGAACDLDGASLTRGSSHTDHHFEAAHLAGGCNSSQLYRAVAHDRGRAVFNGKVHIAPGADGSESLQSSAGLLLSPLAEIDAKPELEIYADEVVASHGATVGQLDEQALFYLQSRGLDRQAARDVLTMAFGRVVSDHLAVTAWREPLGLCMQKGMQNQDRGDD